MGGKRGVDTSVAAKKIGKERAEENGPKRKEGEE